MVPERVVARALAKVMQEGECIVSLYSTGNHGYAQIGWQDGDGTKMVLVHCVAWEAHHGPIPAGLTVDHLCRNRRCCNIEHLRLLTNEENARGNGQPDKTHCPQGHEYTPSNTFVTRRGHRQCRACTPRWRKR